jgi:hypothetical protein
MTDRMPDRMPEDMSDRMPEDLPVRKCINAMVGIIQSEVFFAKWKRGNCDWVKLPDAWHVPPVIKSWANSSHQQNLT